MRGSNSETSLAPLDTTSDLSLAMLKYTKHLPNLTEITLMLYMNIKKQVQNTLDTLLQLPAISTDLWRLIQSTGCRIPCSSRQKVTFKVQYINNYRDLNY